MAAEQDARDALVPQPGEDLQAQYVEDAIHWMGVYLELASGAAVAGGLEWSRRYEGRIESWRVRLASLLQQAEH